MPDPTSAPSPFVTTAAIALAAVVTLAALASACGSTNHGARSTAVTEPGPTTESSTGSTESSGSPSIAPDDNAAVLAALDRYWVVWLAANNPTNPDDPKLPSVLSGEALSQTQDNMRSRLALGQVIEMAPDPKFRHFVEGASTTNIGVILVTECVVDDTLLVEVASHRIVNDAIATYELVKTISADGQGILTISKSVRQSRWDGVAGCALSD